MPETTVGVQESEMTPSARDAFLARFSETEEGDTYVAFCVLGGMFGEGIDLAGDRLIGTVIVGTGLPGVSTQLNLIRNYYDENDEPGMEYAYVYPGLNKVMQAAGRVIRSEDDRGVAVLIDTRYASSEIQRLLPRHWRHMLLTGDVYSLSEILTRFWDEDTGVTRDTRDTRDTRPF